MNKILVVEDELGLLEELHELLTRNQYEVHTAENGRDGYQIARQVPPDLIVSGTDLPEMDGYELLQTLRADKNLADIPFIFLSIRKERDQIRYAMGLGADDYLIKPFTPDDLLAAVATQLRKREAITTYYQTRISALRGSIGYILPPDLRRPLQYILDGTGRLRTHKHNPEQVYQTAAEIYTTGQQLQDIIQQHLIYTEIELRSLKIHRPPAKPEVCTQPKLVVESVVHTLTTPPADAPTIHLDMVDAPIEISTADFQQLISRLLKYGLHAATAASYIYIDGRPVDDGYRLRYQHDGQALTASELDVICHYEDRPRDFASDQVRLMYLIIVRRLTELVHGRCEVIARPSGGMTGNIFLPSADVSPPHE